MVIITTIGGCVIAILISLVIYLFIKLHKYKKRQSDYEIFSKSQLITVPNKYMPKNQISNIVIPIPQQTDLKFNSDKELTSNYKKADGIGDSWNASQEFSNKDLVSAQAQNPNKIETSLSRFESELSYNTNGFNDIEISMLEMANNELPAIDFKLVYIRQNSTLLVHINRVTNLPLQLRKNCSSYVKISLINNSEKLSSYHTNVIKKSLNPEYEEDCIFSPYNFDQLNNLTIRISVYAKRKQLSKRQLIGDLWVPLSRPDLEPDIEVNCNEKLSLACPRTGKRGPLIMAGKLGYLFIQLQYQPEAERLKVIVRKGQNLLNKSISYNNFQITKPDYYVIINLLRNKDAVVYKETKPSAGVSPIWNQPFIFDVQSFESNRYWIQFLVMEGKNYTKDGVIGQVLIGPNTTISGIQHWNDVTKPEFLEIAKWHPISNIGTHCF